MKRSILIFSLGVLLLILAIIEQVFLSNTLQELNTKGNTILSIIDINSADNTLGYINELDGFWEEKEKWVCLLVNHEDVEKIGEQILKTKNNLLINDIESAKQELSLFLFYVDGCQHLLVSSLQNVL